MIRLTRRKFIASTTVAIATASLPALPTLRKSLPPTVLPANRITHIPALEHVETLEAWGIDGIKLVWRIDASAYQDYMREFERNR